MNSACPNNRQKKWRIWSRGKLATFESMALFFLREKSRAVSLTPFFLVEKWLGKNALSSKNTKTKKKKSPSCNWSSLETLSPDKDILTKRNVEWEFIFQPQNFSKCYLSFREDKLLVCPRLLKQHAWGWGWYSEIPWSCLRKENSDTAGFHHPFILGWISIAQNQTVKQSNDELDMTYFNRQNRTLEIWHGIHVSNPYPENYLWNMRIHYVQSLF